MKKHFIFDFDEFIINTSELKKYMGTREGRTYVANNANNLVTTKYSDVVKEVLKTLQKNKQISVVTNAPFDYVQAIWQKHGLPGGVMIHCASNKPSTKNFEAVLKDNGLESKDVLSLGDAVRDILTSHLLKMPSVAGTWGYSTKEQLEKAEPQRIMENPEELEQIMMDFENGKINYQPRQDPKRYFQTKYDPRECIEVIKNHPVGAYYAVGTSCFRNELNCSDILNFKSTKDVTRQELNDGANNYFFHNGILKTTEDNYKAIFNRLKNKTIELIENLDPKGKTLMIAAPNSLPSYAYKMDSNQIMVRNIKLDNIDVPKERIIYRIHPKTESHRGQRTTINEHLNTMGILPGTIDTSYNNVIIFDDVRTDGNQINAIGRLIRNAGYKGNMFSITLGQTRFCEENYDDDWC